MPPKISTHNSPKAATIWPPVKRAMTMAAENRIYPTPALCGVVNWRSITNRAPQSSTAPSTKNVMPASKPSKRTMP